jgi:hypothetical protein
MPADDRQIAFDEQKLRGPGRIGAAGHEIERNDQLVLAAILALRMEIRIMAGQKYGPGLGCHRAEREAEGCANCAEKFPGLVHVSLPTEEHETTRLSLYFSTFLPTIERFSRKTAKSGDGLHQFGGPYEIGPQTA